MSKTSYKIAQSDLEKNNANPPEQIEQKALDVGLNSALKTFYTTVCFIMDAISRADACTNITHKNNAFVKNYNLIKEIVNIIKEQDLTYDQSSLNAPVLTEYFLELKQLKDLQKAVNQPVSSFEDGIGMIKNVVKIFEKFSRGDGYLENRKLIQEYYKVLNTHYNYIKIFYDYEDCRPEVKTFSELLGCYKRSVEQRINDINIIKLDYSINDPNYYDEAIKYINENAAKTSFGTLHQKSIRKILSKLVEIHSDQGNTDAKEIALKYIISIEGDPWEKIYSEDELYYYYDQNSAKEYMLIADLIGDVEIEY